MINRLIKYFLENKLITVLMMVLFILWGIVTAPFGWQTGWLPSDPVSVDAIPDIGQNQQIVFTMWAGRSPQDVEDQVTYPLTAALLGTPGVKSVRSSSMFGLSSIYIIFDEEIDFYWSRARILEKLNSLPSGLLPAGVQPALGPDATALGQVYWYTLEGRDKNGQPAGGWDLDEVRTVQDFYVKYALSSVQGVSEVASIGGFVKEYQIDVDPDALKTYHIPLESVMEAVKMSNRDVGAKTIEINKVEYLIRGIGYVKSVADIDEVVVSERENIPIKIKDIAKVILGPSPRRGVLDKNGSEVVGGVVVARYGTNPMEVIQCLKNKINEISAGLPKKTLADGSESRLVIVPFYDRSELIRETLHTLDDALTLEIIITILVVVALVLNLRAAFVISGLLPMAVLMIFIIMRYFHISANIVALSGIAIAIGTMVDLGIILCENMMKHFKEAVPTEKLIDIIYKSAAEVSSAIITGVSTTVMSFIPVFMMEEAEGKLFRPLAFTKTFGLVSALIVALFILPTIAHWVFGVKAKKQVHTQIFNLLLIVAGIGVIVFTSVVWAGMVLIGFGLAWFIKECAPWKNKVTRHAHLFVAVGTICWLLAGYWMPLGWDKSIFLNFIFVVLVSAVVLGFFMALEFTYAKILRWCLAHKKTFLLVPMLIVFIGANVWFGFHRTLGFMADGLDYVGIHLRNTAAWSNASAKFPGIGKEFMPPLEEGSFLLMPTAMPHAGVEQNQENLQKLDIRLSNILEIETSVGKLGRVESALDPAPVSMYENLISYKSEYLFDEKGKRARFKVDEQSGRFILSSKDTLSNDEIIRRRLTRWLVPDPNGKFFRNWRKKIKGPDDIWKEITMAAKLPGLTSAPKLQPIQTRLIMLQTGMRAPMGIKVFGNDLATIEHFGIQLEHLLKQVPSVAPETAFADRIVGKPYIYLNIDRSKIARYGLSIEAVQKTIETAIGGMEITSTVEGRERFPVRLRYPRELRDDPGALKKIYIATAEGAQIPLSQIVDIAYLRGPQAIKSEDTFLLGFVLFDKKPGFAEADVVHEAQNYIRSKIDAGELTVPTGITYRFSGNYENQVRAEKRLAIIVPIVLTLILLILYFQFKSVQTSLMVFSGIAMAFSGAFIMIWLYGQPWFLNFSVFGVDMRALFQIHPVNLSVAVWVGFIALFGIATDDGVLIATYMDQVFARKRPSTIQGVRDAVVESGLRRIRPAVMTAATTVIALLPVLTSQGKGSDIMIPMAIPAFGGMMVACITFFIVPVLYSRREEKKLIAPQP